MSDTTKAQRGHPSPMMFVSIGIGTAVAIALIVVVSILTSGPVTLNSNTPNDQPKSALVGTTVKGFSLSGLVSGTVHAPWQSGHAAVLIFFASWCGPCKAEMPKVAAYLRSHDQGAIKVVGIDANDQRGAAQSFVARSGVTFPVASDPNADVTAGIFQFATLPETVFVNAKGVVQEVYFGAIPTAQLVKGLAALRAA